MPRSLALALALGAAELAQPVARRVLARRLKAGKEDPDRLGERLGIPGRDRPPGRLIWFHAASVGEALSLLPLVEAVLEAAPDAHVLLTTGTRTSAALMQARLPARAIHQFVPVDTGPAVRRFLGHWRPDLAIWTESELWPRLITATRARDVPMLLVNARLSDRSARQMRRLGAYAASLLARFDAILAQDDLQAERLLRLGAPAQRVTVTGSLKDSAQPLPHDAGALRHLMRLTAGRTVWLAASTHPGEEEIVVAAHREARRTHHGLMLVLAPRHPDRGPALAAWLRDAGWIVAQRAAGEDPDRRTEVYLADTLGEMGLWYRLAAVSFVGGSLVPGIGGHNPFEPALLGSAILAGPHVENFGAVYARFRRAGALVQVPDPEALGAKLAATLPPDRAAALAAAAWDVSSEGADVLGRVMTVIHRHLPPAPADPAPAAAG